MDKKLVGANIKLYQDFPILVPYVADFVNYGRNIMYRTTTDRHILRLIDQDVSLVNRSRGMPSTFHSQLAIIVTYDNIQLYEDYNKRFSYQVVIAADFENTFAIFNYGRLDGDSGDVGFTDPKRYSTKRFVRPSADKRILNKISNVAGGRPGKHVYKLSNSC